MSGQPAPAAKPPEKKLPPTHDAHQPSRRVLEENAVDHELLRSRLGDRVLGIETAFKQTVLKAAPEHVVDMLRCLRDDPALKFEMLTDITAVDNMRREDFEPARRFTVVYVVYSVAHKKRVRVEVSVPEQDPRVPSAAPVFKGAPWIEREVFDMFGIIFDGHPDLRRVLLPDYYEHFPLRKDYPLTGRGERDNFVRAEELE